MAAQPGVQAVADLVITFLGPRQLWVIARIQIEDGLSGQGVEEFLRALERALTDDSRFVARTDLVPSYEPK